MLNILRNGRKKLWKSFKSCGQLQRGIRQHSAKKMLPVNKRRSLTVFQYFNCRKFPLLRSQNRKSLQKLRQMLRYRLMLWLPSQVL